MSLVIQTNPEKHGHLITVAVYLESLCTCFEWLGDKWVAHVHSQSPSSTS